MRSWEPDADLFSSPPLLHAGCHFDLGRASPWSSSELDRERARRKIARHAFLDPKKFPIIFLFLAFCPALPVACWTSLMN
jgi:hypothetical protein